MSLQRLLGAQVVPTVFTVVDKTVGKVPALDMIPHIGLGHVGELEAKGARVTTSSLIGNDVFVKILWLGKKKDNHMLQQASFTRLHSCQAHGHVSFQSSFGFL